MTIVSTVLLALGLALDAFAVAVASGVAIKELRIRHAIRIGAFFGAFQGLMPVVGWSAGLGLQRFIGAYDHWVAFGLCTAVGVKMIFEAFKIREDAEEKEIRALKGGFLLILAIATSLDALAVGVSLSLIDVSIARPALIIGAVTFALSVGGVYVGDRVGHVFENRIEIVAGLILIGIGVRILLGHLL
jgi:putative Mn2+ efflux pump MntP